MVNEVGEHPSDERQEEDDFASCPRCHQHPVW